MDKNLIIYTLESPLAGEKELRLFVVCVVYDTQPCGNGSFSPLVQRVTLLQCVLFNKTHHAQESREIKRLYLR